MEKVIVTDDDTAQRLFHSIKSVPQNAIAAITPTRGNYGSFYIQKPSYMINLLIPEQDLQRQINAQEHEHRAEINKLKKEKEQKFQISGALIEEKKGFEANIKDLQNERSQIKQRKQQLMVKRKQL